MWSRHAGPLCFRRTPHDDCCRAHRRAGEWTRSLEAEMTDTPMYALVATVRVEDPEHARAQLQAVRVELVQRAPGFVSAYWLQPIGGVAMSVIVWASKEHAEAASVYPVPEMAGVTLIKVEMREVFASA